MREYIFMQCIQANSKEDIQIYGNIRQNSVCVSSTDASDNLRKLLYLRGVFFVMPQLFPRNIMLHIRPATHEDLPTLLNFEQGIIAAERPFDPSNKEVDVHYYRLNEMLLAENVHLVVAEEQVSEKQTSEKHGTIIGCGYVRIEDAEEFKKRPLHAYIGFLYLEEAHRGKGVMQSVLQHLEAWAVDRGVLELILEVYYDNQAAVRSYERFGFQKRMILMRKSL